MWKHDASFRSPRPTYGPLFQPPDGAGCLQLCTYAPPHPSGLRTSLLAVVYDNVKNEVDTYLRREEQVC
jgi:hypothetical protein